MWADILGTITAGIYTISIFFISGFSGNDPQISHLMLDRVDYGLVLRGDLENAFEHDFEEILSSGLKITILYETKIRNQGKHVLTIISTVTVVRDHELQQWIIDDSDDLLPNYISNYQDLQKALAKIRINIPLNSREFDSLTVSLKASLPSIYISNTDKNYDLMLLWKKRAPRAKITISLKEIK